MPQTLNHLVNNLIDESLLLSSIHTKNELEHYFFERLKSLNLSPKEWRIALDSSISQLSQLIGATPDFSRECERQITILKYLTSLREHLTEKGFFSVEEFDVRA